ncbi:hypothetical protein Y032_0003g1560 [Ancylostoma ceylanicum]|uniref:Uncharacterized protein n=1 Tax=Ancylostoma ceylanicum TaxID=53326 RepID=A0A016VXU2_9BILA|nr:hypothetical protein Y032_0003g1560 [Ancylostoma ceylanicum]
MGCDSDLHKEKRNIAGWFMEHEWHNELSVFGVPALVRASCGYKAAVQCLGYHATVASSRSSGASRFALATGAPKLAVVLIWIINFRPISS